MTDFKQPLLCDTGMFSRLFRQKPAFLLAFNELRRTHSPFLSPSIYIELQRWLIMTRGQEFNPMSRPDYRLFRSHLNELPILNHGEVAKCAMKVADDYPDTGLGDCFTIGAALFFDVEVFTLNRKHFERVEGIRLYTPSNLPELFK